MDEPAQPTPKDEAAPRPHGAPDAEESRASEKEPERRYIPWEQEVLRLLDQGNFEAILDRIPASARDSLYSRDDMFRCVEAAMSTACRLDPRTFSVNRLYPALIAFATTVRLRLQLAFDSNWALIERGQFDEGRFSSVEKVLRAWQDMARLNAELLHTMAVTARVWALTDKTKQRRPRRRRQTKPAADGYKSFIEGLMDHGN